MRTDGITYEADIEARVWEHLNTVGPAGSWHVFWAVKAWQEAHGYGERPKVEEPCDCDDDDDQ